QEKDHPAQKNRRWNFSWEKAGALAYQPKTQPWMEKTGPPIRLKLWHGARYFRGDDGTIRGGRIFKTDREHCGENERSCAENVVRTRAGEPKTTRVFLDQI